MPQVEILLYSEKPKFCHRCGKPLGDSVFVPKDVRYDRYTGEIQGGKAIDTLECPVNLVPVGNGWQGGHDWYTLYQGKWRQGLWWNQHV